MGNDYGHPHRETLDKLNDAGVQIYRTDEQDTILAVCDGTDVTFQTGSDLLSSKGAQPCF